MLSIELLLGLAGCTATSLEFRDAPASGDSGAELLPGTDGEEDDDDDEPAAGSDEALWGCASVFEQDYLPEYHIEISSAEWAAISAEYAARDGSKLYHPLTSFELDGERVDGVHIRLKGNEGYSWVGEKMQFVISFVEENPDQRFHGLRHVAFDATWYDPSLLNNRTAARFLRRAGLPAPCANNGRLVINGSYYGVYAHMEQLDREYLERNFGKDAADGNLYKYGYELTNNEGADTSRMQSWWSSYEYEHLATLGDPEQWITEWAAEAAMPDLDGYWYSGHNYYLYDHPEQGLMYLPWDLDATFYYGNAPSLDPLSVYWDYVPHMASTLSERENLELFVDKLQQARDAFDAEQMEAEVEAWGEQIAESVRDDQVKTFSTAEHTQAVQSLREFFAKRTDFLDAWLAANGD